MDIRDLIATQLSSVLDRLGEGMERLNLEYLNKDMLIQGEPFVISVTLQPLLNIEQNLSLAHVESQSIN